MGAKAVEPGQYRYGDHITDLYLCLVQLWQTALQVSLYLVLVLKCHIH